MTEPAILRDMVNLKTDLERARDHVSRCYRFMDRHAVRELTTLERNQLAIELSRGSVALGSAIHRVSLHEAMTLDQSSGDEDVERGGQCVPEERAAQSIVVTGGGKA